MSKKSLIGRGALYALILGAILIPQAASRADSASINFEPPLYTTGSVNGQDGWSALGPYDQAIVPNVYGYASFGSQSLRISNAVTSGSFGDQIFSKPLVNEAGETDAKSGGFSGGVRQRHFDAAFDLASTVATEQPGLRLTVSPDRGDGARMSFLRVRDTSSGLAIDFDDYQSGFVGVGCNDSNFVETTIATGLNRAVPHRIGFSMDFLDGVRNDVVRILVDGVVVHTGTSWEDFFRECQPGLGPGFGSRTVDSVLFRVAGLPCTPSCAGQGLLIDNLFETSSNATTPSVVVLETGGSTNVTEGGTCDTVLVWLSTQPTGDVFISSGAVPDSEGNPQVHAEPHPLIFTPSNYSVPQKLVICAIDDTIPEGPHTGVEALAMTSPDPNYNQPTGAIALITANITDNDGNFRLVETNGNTVVAEGGFTDTYLIKLVVQPTANVVVTATPDTQVTVSPSSLTFTPANYNVYQTITVTAVDDIFVEGQHLGVIKHTTASADPAFDNKPVPTVSAVVIDNDPPDVTPPAAPVIGNCPAGPISTKTFTLTGSAEAFSAVNVSRDGKTVGSVRADKSGVWSILLGFPKNGTFSFTAVSVDAAGNTSPPSAACLITVSADFTPPPVPTITSPANNAITPATVTLSGTAFGDTVTMRLFDGDLLVSEFDASAPSWSATLTLTSGLHFFSVAALDAAGNLSAHSDVTTITVDADPPQVSIRQPLMTILIQLALPTDPWGFDGIASDQLSGIDHITVTLSPFLLGAPSAHSASTCTPCPSAPNQRVVWSDDLAAGGATPGLYDITVTAFDRVGNAASVNATVLFIG